MFPKWSNVNLLVSWSIIPLGACRLWTSSCPSNMWRWCPWRRKPQKRGEAHVAVGRFLPLITQQNSLQKRRWLNSPIYLPTNKNTSKSTWTSVSTTKKVVSSFHTKNFMYKNTQHHPTLVVFVCFWWYHILQPHTNSRCSERPHNHCSRWSNYRQWNSLHGPLPKAPKMGFLVQSILSWQSYVVEKNTVTTALDHFSFLKKMDECCRFRPLIFQGVPKPNRKCPH